VRDCEAACRRKYVDEAVSVNALKRFVADIDKIDMWKPQLKQKRIKGCCSRGGLQAYPVHII